MPQDSQLTSGSASPTVERIRGGTQIRIVIIRALGWVLCILAVGFVIIIVRDPELAKGTGGALLHIISGVIFLLVGFVVGQKTSGAE